MISQKWQDEKVRGEQIIFERPWRREPDEEVRNGRAFNKHAVRYILTSQGATDTNAALSAAGQMTGGIRVFVENYPDYGVGSNSHSVLVQIESSFNRIEYARTQLITEQTNFNKWLLTQIPMNLFYHPVQILGSNANPAESVPVPRYVQPTP
jgi:hypothetical protein